MGSMRMAAAFVALLALGNTASAQTFQTHEAYVESLFQPTTLDLKDKKAVFDFVLKSLPERVKVYPSEHYYYFRFMHRGQTYTGNIRLENDLRDQGKVHFAYAPEFTSWLPISETEHQLFEKKDGIDVERVDPLTYRITSAGKSVVFELNDLAKVKVPPEVIAQGEKLIGPMFDESAVRFFLVYNSKLRQFLYILDETGPPADALVSSQVSDRILIGKRTGFAFYNDHKLNRRILIGVVSSNVALNNYFDGPFDQLPDNMIEGDTLKDAILEVDPSLKGKIDRFGSSFDGETRFMIAPYLQYGDERELSIFHRCATSKKVKPEHYYACFAISDNERGLMTTRAEAKEAGKPQRARR
ncbi:hypothetical protein GJW-30_1_03886 [Variibacter gotjawalensis]|uniref:Uncharacterized protein n=1 Tax=Variibacter gotjawalensis TaxID=1333996 RepID=A0A0S3PZG6_9BRAD|nr:hypothetical protein [Variibacter gotjawalensis]NIK47167.1 hypothetical protein [Variibacter gotjawalensis]RZS49067.1 hypothetical protein EV661_1492 [Variibacter gotjawalensis]BAT61329.1 hypothetical protein GJW-30_1_03886 [Variibacter gotjawalensis]